MRSIFGQKKKYLISERAFTKAVERKWIKQARCKPQLDQGCASRFDIINKLSPSLAEASKRCELKIPLDLELIEDLTLIRCDLTREILFYQLTKIIPKYCNPKTEEVERMKNVCLSIGKTLVEPLSDGWIVEEWLKVYKELCRIVPPYAAQFIYRHLEEAVRNIECPNSQYVIDTARPKVSLRWAFRSIPPSIKNHPSKCSFSIDKDIKKIIGKKM